jgi:signal transduction histidine kinase
VYAFVQRQRGTIHVSSRPGEGTVFRLWFPPADAAPVEAAGAEG